MNFDAIADQFRLAQRIQVVYSLCSIDSLGNFVSSGSFLTDFSVQRSIRLRRGCAQRLKRRC